MNITKEDIDDVNSIIKLTIEKSDYEQQVDKSLKDYQKKAQIPGFRPGKVPFGMIQKMYRTSVLIEELNKIVNENLLNYIKENNLKILGEPLPNQSLTKIDLNNNDIFYFAFDIGLVPEFELKLTKKDRMPYYQILVEDEMIENEILAIKNKFGEKVDSDIIDEKSTINGYFIQVDDDNNELAEGIKSENKAILTEVINDEEIKNLLLGKKVDDSVIFNIRKAFPNDTEISYLLSITKEEAEKVNENFKFTVSNITNFKPSDLNQELFDKVFGEEVVFSEEEMKSFIKKKIEDLFIIESDFYFRKIIQKKLVSKCDFILPEEFLKQWIIKTQKEKLNISDEKLEEEFPKLFETFKWQIIYDKIIFENDLYVDDADVSEYIKKLVKRHFSRYGVMNFKDEFIEYYAASMLKEQKNKQKLIDEAQFDKLVSFVKESVKLDEKVVNRNELNELNELMEEKI